MSGMKQLIIPSKIKVGFNKRDDCYTGMLGYVIYQDRKGVWRKEDSWEKWRTKYGQGPDLGVKFHDNAPTEGFVLNKDVGGGRRSSWSWNARLEKVRVYDPRDFEFEITIPNLLFILREGDCSRGKGLEGQFVYAWSGKELILLPIASQEYKESSEFTSLQTKKVKAKELIAGATYITKKEEKLVYIGRFDVYVHGLGNTGRYRRGQKEFPVLEYVFWNEKSKGFEFMDSPISIAAVVSDVPIPDFAERAAEFGKSNYGTKVASLFLKEFPTRKDDWYDYWSLEKETGKFLLIHTSRQGSYYGSRSDSGEVQYIEYHHSVSLDKGRIVWKALGNIRAYSPYGYGRQYKRDEDPNYQYYPPTKMRLCARMESGSEFLVGSGNLVKIEQPQEVVVNGQENG